MKGHSVRTARRNKTARASVFGLAVLMVMALVSLLAWGCGEGASLPRSLSAAATLPVATTSAAAASAETADVAQTRGSSSLHERIMAEQGRTGAAPAGRVTATTSSSLPQSTTTTSTVPSVESDVATAVVLTGGQTPLKGIWGGTAERLAYYLLEVCPSPRFTVPTPVLADYYVRYCAEAGLRADLLWAQMVKETGYGMYGGAVLPEQNNYAGIGATGGGEPGAWFPTAEAGVMAHVAHMVAYVYASSPVSWADANTDPRFDSVDPRGVASVLADLNGRWAVPGSAYGESIEEIAWAINAD
jgi:hypothetical protein